MAASLNCIYIADVFLCVCRRLLKNYIWMYIFRLEQQYPCFSYIQGIWVTVISYYKSFTYYRNCQDKRLFFYSANNLLQRCLPKTNFFPHNLYSFHVFCAITMFQVVLLLFFFLSMILSNILLCATAITPVMLLETGVHFKAFTKSRGIVTASKDFLSTPTHYEFPLVVKKGLLTYPSFICL